MAQKDIRIAVDIGGTFTDGIAVLQPDGAIWVGKCLTTPDDPGIGVSEVIAQLLTKIAGGAPGAASAVRVAELVHGTTLVTNALIERAGATIGLVVTPGTEDTLEIRRETRYDLYDLALELPASLVPTERIFSAPERMLSDGTPERRPDRQELDRLADDLAAAGVDAVAICLLHGYVNDEHERAIADAIQQRLPGIPVSLSSRVAREIREYERMSTTAANAYVQPLMESYLSVLTGRLKDAAIDGPLRIMLSSGGFTSADAAADVPIQLLESGPAAGVLSAVNTGTAAGERRVLAFDMGGTTAKACVALDGEPYVAHSFEAGRVRRFKKGSGLPIMIPSIDLIEIGAGGGSIAGVSSLGLLQVGPRSAGAVPGPACYGRGGTAPTVTDADLVLGYLDGSSFLGGEMALDVEAAKQALAALGEKLGMSATETAWGVANIVNENMAAAARIHIAEKGFDPRSFTLVATGGAGPVHTVEVARKLGIKRVLCPIAAGAGSCLGLLAAPARVDRSWSRPTVLSAVDWKEAHEIMSRLQDEAYGELAVAGAADRALVWTLTLEMCFLGQGSTVTVTLPYGPIDESWEKRILAGFETEYTRLFGATVPDAHPQIVTWRLTGRSEIESYKFVWAEDRAQAAGDPEPKGHRSIYIPKSDAYASAPVFDRYSLAAGASIAGPAILEERESTVVIAAAARISVLDDLTISIELEDEA